MAINLFAKMDNPDLFMEFQIILKRKGRTVKEEINEFVEKYVRKNKEK